MKKIKLTQNQKVTIDDEDYEFLNQFKWYGQKSKNTYYAARRMTKRKIMYMHILIMGKKEERQLEPWEEIDHINGNGLDNRRCNLRIVDRSKNAMNRKKMKEISSIYKGVCWYKNYEKWRTQIKINGETKHLGYFNNEIDAGKAYDKAAKELFGEFARLNFEE